jgi:hypothetical protein
VTKPNGERKLPVIKENIMTQLQLFPNDWKTFALSLSSDQLQKLYERGYDDVYYALREIRSLIHKSEAEQKYFERKLNKLYEHLN